jgi:urease accessory protein
MTAPVAVAPSAWEARLALDFRREGSRSVLSRIEHKGPLVVQKPLYPEGEGVCQAIVVHPPGGIAGGDRLAVVVNVGAAAHAQLTTPGAAKWYRSAGAVAAQTLRIDAGPAAVCEWLPQEAIVFDGARALIESRVSLAADAVFIGWDVVCLGRTASGERFASGGHRQRFELVRDGALVWAERMVIDGGDGFAASPVGLAGYPVFGTFVAAAPRIEDNVLAACRDVPLPAGDERIEGAVTRLPGILVARCRGEGAEAARRWFADLWGAVRPLLCGRRAVPARIWNT